MAKHDLINPSVSHHCGTEQSPPSLPTMQSCPSQRCAVWPSNFRGFGPKGIDNSPRNIYMSAAPRSAFALNIPVQITCQCSVSVQSPVACSRSFPRPVPHSRHSHYSFLLPSALDEPHFASSASCISVATLLLLLAAACCCCLLLYILLPGADSPLPSSNCCLLLACTPNLTAFIFLLGIPPFGCFCVFAPPPASTYQIKQDHLIRLSSFRYVTNAANM